MDLFVFLPPVSCGLAGCLRHTCRVAVEVVTTMTSADVMWQDGSVECNIRSNDLFPVHHLDNNEFCPGDFVVDKRGSAGSGEGRRAEGLGRAWEGWARGLGGREETPPWKVTHFFQSWDSLSWPPPASPESTGVLCPAAVEMSGGGRHHQGSLDVPSSVSPVQSCPDPAVYGVVQSGDHVGRTCMVKWFRLRPSGDDVEVSMCGPRFFTVAECQPPGS